MPTSTSILRRKLTWREFLQWYAQDRSGQRTGSMLTSFSWWGSPVEKHTIHGWVRLMRASNREWSKWTRAKVAAEKALKPALPPPPPEKEDPFTDW